jgi:hypothetical protein
MWMSMRNCIIYIYILFGYDQNLKSLFMRKVWVREIVEQAPKPLVQCSLVFCRGKAHCNGSSSVSTQTWNRTVDLELFLTWSFEYTLTSKLGVLGGGLCISTSMGGTPFFWEPWATRVSLGGAGGIPGVGGISYSRGAAVPLRLEQVCDIFAVLFSHGMQQYIWSSWMIAGCYSITAFTVLCPGNPNPRIFASQNSAVEYFIIYLISPIAMYRNTTLAIMAKFKARYTSDSSSCIRPTCAATVADMLKSYWKLDAASIYVIWVLPLP